MDHYSAGRFFYSATLFSSILLSKINILFQINIILAKNLIILLAEEKYSADDSVKKTILQIAKWYYSAVKTSYSAEKINYSAARNHYSAVKKSYSDAEKTLFWQNNSKRGTPPHFRVFGELSQISNRWVCYRHAEPKDMTFVYNFYFEFTSQL